MPLYLVCLPPSSSPHDTLGSSARTKLNDSTKLKDHIKVWDNAYFVNAKRSSDEIAEELEIHPNGLGLVVLLELRSTSGRASRESVQWLLARSEKPSS